MYMVYPRLNGILQFDFDPSFFIAEKTDIIGRPACFVVDQATAIALRRQFTEFILHIDQFGQIVLNPGLDKLLPEHPDGISTITIHGS